MKEKADLGGSGPYHHLPVMVDIRYAVTGTDTGTAIHIYTDTGPTAC